MFHLAIDNYRRPIGRGASRSGELARLLDRHVFGCLLRAIGAVRSRRNRPLNPSKIGLVVINAIGDALIASAIIEDVRRIFPEAHITLVVSNGNRSVVPLIPCIDDTLVLPLFRPCRSVSQLRRRAFDLIIDCTQWARITAVYASLSGAYCVGFRTPGQPRSFAYDFSVDHSGVRHELYNFRALLDPIGIVPLCFPRVEIPLESRAEMPTEIREGPYIVLHPWAGGENGWRREWPIMYWVALAERIAARGYSILVTGGPSDRPVAEQLIVDAASNGVVVRNVAGKFSLPATAALIEGATAVVCVNTGVMHLASCLGVPLVALHGPTNPTRWGPLSERSAVIQPSQGPRGYLNLGFEYPRNVIDCMPSIAVDAVWRALLHLLADQGDKVISDKDAA
jgi:heptosyltransferase-3